MGGSETTQTHPYSLERRPAIHDELLTLSPIAAVGLLALMVGAGVTHFKRNEVMPFVAINSVLGGLAGYVAYAGFVG